jgi:hypothetical protein
VFKTLLLLSTILSSIPGVAQEADGGSIPADWPILIGTEQGLYGMNRIGVIKALRQGGSVRKILRGGDYWALLGDQGIAVSRDLLHWEDRNGNLPVKTIKLYEDGEKSFITQVQEIKDLEINPDKPEVLVCAVKDRVFLSRDAGLSWESLGFPPFRTNGIKAVASAYLPPSARQAADPQLTVFLSHSTYGVYYITPGVRGAAWTELSAGLEQLETTGNPDEISDIAAVSGAGKEPDIYVSQTFRRRIYRLSWAEKRFKLLWSDSANFGAADSLDIGAETLRFLREGELLEFNRNGENAEPKLPLAAWPRPEIPELIQTIKRQGFLPLSLAVREDGLYPGSEFMSLCELWLLDEDRVPGGQSADMAGGRGRRGIYLPVNRAMDDQSLKPYLDLIEERSLDMVVIDMKDDYGRLRFTPHTPGIAEKGRVFRPVDIDGFLRTLKERGIYAAARIVVFKDPELARKEGGRYAVWDGRNNKPWTGYYDTRRKKPEAGQNPEANSPYVTEILPSDEPGYEVLRTYYDERWVDPYSEVVWEYTAALARELHERGFDEIQFDYIRFPTDGQNLADARYRWQDRGMDMESAMLSFLRHVRSRLDAPISIDIYGANGWYRTGARTGQEVELLARYVDVICPMYYPSHFEQDFLAQTPAELRPYRIYYMGTQRTHLIGRGQVIVRPYVQAFYLNVSYDRRYYNADYVRRQVEGVRDAGGPGFTFWNNSGRYDDIPYPK